MQVITAINTVVQVVVATSREQTRTIRNDRPFLGRNLIIDILEGHPLRCHDLFWMSPTNFRLLCDEVAQKRIIKTDEVSVEEQVGIFLQILVHSTTMRKVSEDFQRSLETVHRCFKDVLRSVLRMRNEYMQIAGANTSIPAQVSEGSPFFPFKVNIYDLNFLSLFPFNIYDLNFLTFIFESLTIFYFYFIN
jgi:hypothetical protein